VQIIWPLSTEGYVTLINQSAGTRAAAARIRISRFRDDLPPSQAARTPGGRTFAYWSEEGDNFSIMLGAKRRPFLEAANRWYQMIRFYGGNAMSGCGIAYQGASWEARAWKGIGFTRGYSTLRLFALLGEKYGMSFIPEWFGNQWFMDKVVYPMRAGGEENSQAKNAAGGLAGGGVNALCPAVQDVILATMREIHGEIGDSPAFRGLTVRADGWQFRGEFFFKSIYWGYNESNVRAFERETGVTVPAGSATDYFKFLTSPAVKDRWVAWRCAKIADFHGRILQALRGGTRTDVFFGIAGQFDQEGLYAKEKTYAARALGSGVDSVARRTSDGLSLIPCARFGWRTPNVEGRAIYDEYFQKESTDGGMGAPRAFASYMNYHELGTSWPIAQFGIDLKEKGGHPPYLCSASVAAGRAALEKYAVVLAEQDTSYFREGGNADSFGSADVMGPWLARYESLPAVAFDRVPGKNDPVAVWQKTVGGRLRYYAVNKESFATTATLTFSDGTVLEYTLTALKGDVTIAGQKPDGTPVDEVLDSRKTYEPAGGSNWSYWTGNVLSPGVSDSATPISRDGMKEIWKVSTKVDGGSMTWRTPGSAVCVGLHTYFYDGEKSSLRCVVTSTGKEVASVQCRSDALYNMALAVGDGKVFVPTLVGSSTVVRAYDAATLEQLFVCEPISGGEVQGPIIYRDGKVFLGTYYGEFACFDTDDTDDTRDDETVSARWKVDAEGWYNMAPAFFGQSCVIVEKGFETRGATAYSVDVDTGAILDSIHFDREYCTSGPGSYDGRVFIAFNRVTDRDVINPDASNGKTLTIRSFSVGSDGKFDRTSEKVWMSDVKDGGTQSIPIIWNGRLYIGGGGSTMGSNEPFTVLDVASDGTMSLAYTVGSIQSKSTAALTTAYSTAGDHRVHLRDRVRARLRGGILRQHEGILRAVLPEGLARTDPRRHRFQIEAQRRPVRIPELHDLTRRVPSHKERLHPVLLRGSFQIVREGGTLQSGGQDHSGILRRGGQPRRCPSCGIQVFRPVREGQSRDIGIRHPAGPVPHGHVQGRDRRDGRPPADGVDRPGSARRSP